MKKILSTISCLFILFSINAQDLPKYYIVKGDTIGMTLSMGQVKKIKSDLELKSVLEEMKISCDSLSSKSKTQEKDCNDRITSKEKIIYGMDTSIISKNNIIKNLRDELLTTKLDRDIHKSASHTKDSLNIITNLRLSEVKTQRDLFFGGTVLFLITTVALFLFH